MSRTVVKFCCSESRTTNPLAFRPANLYRDDMSKNSKKLDAILRAKKGPRVAIAATIRAEPDLSKSMLHAHRNGAVPTLPWVFYYEAVAGLVPEEWLSGADNGRAARRILRARQSNEVTCEH